MRVLGSSVIVVALYYLLPLDHLSQAGSALLLVVGLLGIAIIVWWEVRAILNAQYPAVEGIAALALTVPLFLVLFAAAYYLLERATASNFSQPLSRTDALYFTVTTFSTVGYGDITAKSQGARVMVIFQMVADLIIVGFGVKVIFGAVQMGRQRQEVPTANGTSAPLTPVATTPDQRSSLTEDRQGQDLDR
jgi:hypothetical protein